MRQYKEISVDNYFIQELTCKCNKCRYEFLEYIPSNYELVCFVDNDGEKYYMPTYGEFGYLDLMERLVGDWTKKQTITPKVVEKFEKEFIKVLPFSVSMLKKVKCPTCYMEDIKVVKRRDINNYPIKWIKIDVESIELHSEPRR